MRQLTWIQWIVFILFFGFALSITVYNGRYNLLHHSLSSLGNVSTGGGGSNLPCAFVFSLTCWSAAGILLKAIYVYRSLWLLLIFSGLTFLPLPCDLYPNLHSVFAAFLVGGLFFLEAGSLLLAVKTQKKEHAEYFRVLLKYMGIFIPLICYALLHIFRSPLREEFQTFALLMLIVGLLMKENIRYLEKHRSLSLTVPTRHSG